MPYAQVALDIPSQQIAHAFEYAVPETLRFAKLSVGCAVQVPFGRRSAIGYVMGISDEPQGEPDALKPIEAQLTSPLFDKLAAECAAFLSERYVAPPASCIRLFLPAGATPKALRDEVGNWTFDGGAAGLKSERYVCKGEAFSEYQPKPNAKRQIAILEAIAQEDMPISQLRFLYGDIMPAIRTLESVGAVKVETRERFASIGDGNRPDPGEGAVQGDSASSDPNKSLQLTDSQEKALEAIASAMDSEGAKAVVLDGVTGSGKTEVYLRAIEKCIAEGHGAIMLVPEISLTPQMVSLFKRRFGDLIALLHSQLTDAERRQQWALLRDGSAKIAIGPRSALFAPIRDLGLVIVDEEHEGTYKNEQAPRYVTRDVAWWLARKVDGALVLGSATPSIEALFMAKENPDWERVEMPERVNGKPLPEIEIVDMRKVFREEGGKLLSKRLLDALFRELSLGHKAVLLLNQRGFANYMVCHDCGFVPRCKHCSTTLTYHESGNKLMCHHCGLTLPAPAKCPACSSPYLKKSGAGTQRLEAELNGFLASLNRREAAIEKNAVRQLADPRRLPNKQAMNAISQSVTIPARNAPQQTQQLQKAQPHAMQPQMAPINEKSAHSPVNSGSMPNPGQAAHKAGMQAIQQPQILQNVRVVRMDSDTTAKRGSHRLLLEEFAKSGPAILLGTQMIAKGLDFKDVTLVAVVDVDQQLNLPDFRASERTFDLIDQVAGRAGRSDLPGQVLVQTHCPDDIAIKAAAKYDRKAFLDSELPKRKLMHYPPYSRIANILVWGKDRSLVERDALVLHARFAEILSRNKLSGWSVSDVLPCTFERIRNQWRYHIVLKSPARKNISMLVADAIRNFRTAKGVKMAVDIDPQNML